MAETPIPADEWLSLSMLVKSPQGFVDEQLLADNIALAFGELTEIANLRLVTTQEEPE